LRAGMIGPQFSKKDVKGDGFGALHRELLDQATVNLAWPIQAEMKAKGPVPYVLYTLLVDEHKPQIRCHRGMEMQCEASAQIEGHPFHPFEKIQLEQTRDADENNHSEGNENRYALERLQLHAGT